MNDWNVIVTIKGQRFRAACQTLEPLGQVKRTAYYNVLAMTVADIDQFVETLRQWFETYADTAELISRVAPVREAFHFQSPEQFEEEARRILSEWAPRLAGRRFHVRMHRRGWKEKMARTCEESYLGGIVLEQLERAGTPAQVDFRNPDAIVAVETLDCRAGLALWTRDQLLRYPFLKLD